MNSFYDIIQSDVPVLVDFSAEWCGPCKMMAPILKEIKNNLGDQVKILKVDVDRNPHAALEYQIHGVPTLIIFQKGQIKWRQSGVVGVRQLEKALRQVTAVAG